MRFLPVILSLFVLSFTASAQSYRISAFAGGALPLNGPGASAGLYSAQSVAVDVNGNVYFEDGNCVLKLDANSGLLTLVAGNGTVGFSGDNGPAVNAQLNNPTGVSVDSAGNIYITDTGNNRVRKISNGTIVTVAGNGDSSQVNTQGPALSTPLVPTGDVAIDSAGNLYVIDGALIRRISSGVVSTVAGNGTAGFSGDNGAAVNAQLNQPTGIAVDSSGNLYISDIANSRVRKVSNGVITTIAGTGTYGFSGDNGPATSAQVGYILGLTVDSAGNLFMVDGDVIRKIAGGVITTVAGGGVPLGDGGPATSARLFLPTDVTVDSSGNLFIADWLHYRIRKVSAGVITTIAGNGTGGFAGDNGPATSAGTIPAGVATDANGNVYIADAQNNRIRKVANGVITTVAGNGAPGNSGDSGPATAASLFYPAAVAADSSGALYIADQNNSVVRRVANGIITTVAGGGSSLGDNGPALNAQFVPMGLAVDSTGVLYIMDGVANRIRKVANGVITTVAGGGTSPDDGPAANSKLNGPVAIALDSAGTLYISDSGSLRVRKVKNGVISTVAGNGTAGFSGDNGPATSAALNKPAGIAIDSAGNLFIADGRLIREIINGTIVTIAGQGSSYGDNGPAISAQTGGDLESLALDSSGKLYVADSANFRVRLLTPAPPAAQTITFAPLSDVLLGVPSISLTAASTSGFAVSFASTTPAVCTVAGATVNVIALGSCSLVASQPGNAGYAAATPVTQTFQVNSAGGGPQSISFAPLPDVTFGATPFALSATASSTLPVAYTASPAAVCTVAGNILTLTGGGTCTVTATQAGNAVFPPAAPVTQAFQVQPAAGAPRINEAGVASLFSKVTTIQPGAWANMYGANFTPPGVSFTWDSDFPTALGGVTVTINGKRAYLWYVGEKQINFQPPDDSAFGPVDITVTTPTGSWTSQVTLGPYAPSLSVLDGVHVTGIILRRDGSGAYGDGVYDILGPTGNSLGFGTVAAKAGDILELFGVGFGPTDQFVPAGQLFSGAANTLKPVQLMIGTTVVTPFFAGLSQAGLDQINVTIPEGLGSGDLPLTATINGLQTQPGIVISLQ